MIDDDVSSKIIGAAFKVHNELGFGFVESIYERALSFELSELEINHRVQAPISVIYRNQLVGNFVCDIVVDENPKLIVELKSVRQLVEAFEVQLVNYLTATSIDIGLLINFGPKKVEVKRKFRDGLDQ